MSVIDDIKNKIGDNSTSSRSLDSDLDSDFDSSFNSQDSQTGNDSIQGNNLDDIGNNQPDFTSSSSTRNQAPNQGSNPGVQNNPTRENFRNNNPSQQPNRSQNTSNRRQPKNNLNNRGSRSNPNPQSGRPQPGQDSPQLSTNTRKKMQNAGMDPANPRSVSQNQSDLDQIKAQNEQIIDLLKRLNQTLNNI